MKVKEKVTQFTNFVNKKANHFGTNEDESKAEEDFTRETEQMVNKLYTYDPDTEKKPSELIDELDTLVMEDSKKLPFTNFRIVSEEKFMDVLDTLRLKTIGNSTYDLNGTTPSRINGEPRYDIANDPDVVRAKKYSKQIKLMTNDYCLDLLNKTQKILSELVKEIDNNKKEL